MIPILILGVEDHRLTNLLWANVEEALKKLGLELETVLVDDIERIIKSGISGIPALVVQGEVVAQKIVPSINELEVLLETHFNKKKPPAAMKNILIPTDFSITAKGAFNYARKMAREQNAGIKVVHVHYPEVSAVEIHASSLFTEGLEFKQKRLKNFVRQDPAMMAENEILTATAVENEVVVGFPGETLVGMSKEEDVDLIVMGTTGESGLLEKVFGSISSHVARKAHCPVLLIPNDVAYKPCKNILFATSHHISDQTMMENIFGLLNCRDADIHFVHIDQKNDVAYRIADTNIGSNLSGRFRVVNIESTDTMKGLNRYANENDIDLVAIATTHRPFFEDMFHRSLTKKMALTTELPLLVLHFND